MAPCQQRDVFVVLVQHFYGDLPYGDIKQERTVLARGLLDIDAPFRPRDKGTGRASEPRGGWFNVGEVRVGNGTLVTGASMIGPDAGATTDLFELLYQPVNQCAIPLVATRPHPPGASPDIPADISDPSPSELMTTDGMLRNEIELRLGSELGPIIGRTVPCLYCSYEFTEDEFVVLNCLLVEDYDKSVECVEETEEEEEEEGAGSRDAKRTYCPMISFLFETDDLWHCCVLKVKLIPKEGYTFPDNEDDRQAEFLSASNSSPGRLGQPVESWLTNFTFQFAALHIASPLPLETDDCGHNAWDNE